MTPTLRTIPSSESQTDQVNDEPHHIEQLRNAYVRVYLATIEPGKLHAVSPTPR